MLGPTLSSWNLRKWPILRLIQFYVWSEYFYIGEPPKFQNLFMMSQSKRLVVPRKKSSELERHLQLINTDHLSNITKVKEKHTHTHIHAEFENNFLFLRKYEKLALIHILLAPHKMAPLESKTALMNVSMAFGFSTSIKEDILHKQNTSLSIFS